MILITWNVQWCRGVDGRVDPARIVSAAKDLADFEDVIREIARRSLVAVRHRLSDTAYTMSDAELRGYVRARAMNPVRRTAEQVANNYGWRFEPNEPFVARSLERTVHMVVHQLRTQAVVAPSAVHATLRAAS